MAWGPAARGGAKAPCKHFAQGGFIPPGANEIKGLPSGKPDGKTTQRIHAATAAMNWRWRGTGSNKQTKFRSVWKTGLNFLSMKRASGTGNRFLGQTFTNCSQTNHNSAKILGYLNTQAKGPPNPMRFLPPKTHTAEGPPMAALLLLSQSCIFSAGGVR